LLHDVLYHPGALPVPNVAVTVSGPVIVTFCGVVVPASAPVNPVKLYPLAAAALTATTLPLFTQPLAGVMLPPPAGLAAVVR
jgi:hypothetical protein